MRIRLLIFLFISYSFNSSSQDLSVDEFSWKNQEFHFQVKQLDQFINRFNYNERLGSDEKFVNDTLFERKRALISLLNLEDSTLFNKSTEDFINYICNNDLKSTFLKFNDDNWYAKVNCTIKYGDKEEKINLILKNEGNNNKGFKWVIRGINAPFIELQSQYHDTIVFLGPMNHELSFMGLFDVFSDYENITDYAYNDFKPDDLSVFFFMVKSKEIRYLKVNSIQYHFLQVPNWIFTVDYFNRATNNSGWLISSVIKLKNSEKKSYKKNKLHLR